MSVSKNKGLCCYSNSKGKISNKSKITTVSPQNQGRKQNHLKEGLYDELMNQLQIQDSEYIGKLIKKNERKMQRNKTVKSKNNISDHQVTHLHTHQVNSKSSEQPTPWKDCNSHDKSAALINQQTSKQIPLRETTQAYLSSVKSQQDSCFLSGLDEYLCALKTSSKQQTLTRKQCKIQRQFRKTIDTTQKIKCERTIQIPVAKYQKLLTKLSQSLVCKDRLESELQSANQKISEMKLIIKSMYFQIHEMAEQLQQQKVQKQKYCYMLEQFASKVRSVRHSSKEKPYLLTHFKRNSCIPSSVNQYSCQNYFNSTDINRILYDETNQYDHKRKQTAHLKKKSNLHKNRINQDFVDSNEGRLSCDSASIYDDRSCFVKRN